MKATTAARIVTLIAVSAATAFAANVQKTKSAAKKKSAPLPAATYESVSYGEHKMQCVDVWLPEGAKTPTPVVVNIHGGGFRVGSRRGSGVGRWLDASRKAGAAFVSVEYRLLKDVKDAKPPVSACMDDIFAAVRLVRSKAKEWNLDTSRMGLVGGSAGAHSSLCVAFTDDNAMGIRAVFAYRPQTSMDPKEMREWIPNSRYGGALFGYKNFQEWFDHRDDCAKWIEKYSPAVLLGKCAPSKAPTVICGGCATPKPGEVEKDPTHSGVFIDKFIELSKARGVSCRRGTFGNFLSELKK